MGREWRGESWIDDWRIGGLDYCDEERVGLTIGGLRDWIIGEEGAPR
jgi:hypothetical protein